MNTYQNVTDRWSKVDCIRNPKHVRTYLCKSDENHFATTVVGQSLGKGRLLEISSILQGWPFEARSSGGSEIVLESKLSHANYTFKPCLFNCLRPSFCTTSKKYLWDLWTKLRIYWLEITIFRSVGRENLSFLENKLALR